MIIGVDFDNTIVTYDKLFWNVAREQGLIPEFVPVVKNEVRNYLRAAGMEETWIEMQGYVYGARMNEAEPADGVLEFFRECCARRVPVLIISHKTRRPYAGPDYDLHAAAQGWLREHGFLGPSGLGLAPQNVFFDLTKQEKIARIRQQRCTAFVDDLLEIFEDPAFPPGVKKLLYGVQNDTAKARDGEIVCCPNWQVTREHLFE
jgi:hypothetical protein